MFRSLPSVCLLVLILTACKKDDPAASLPAPTQDGRNTAGCFINGHAFVAHAYGGGPLSAPLPALAGGFAFDSSYHLLMRGQLNGEAVEVMLFLQGRKPGTYLLNRTTPYYPQATPGTCSATPPARPPAAKKSTLPRRAIRGRLC